MKNKEEIDPTVLTETEDLKRMATISNELTTRIQKESRNLTVKEILQEYNIEKASSEKLARIFEKCDFDFEPGSKPSPLLFPALLKAAKFEKSHGKLKEMNEILLKAIDISYLESDQLPPRYEDFTKKLPQRIKDKLTRGKFDWFNYSLLHANEEYYTKYYLEYQEENL